MGLIMIIYYLYLFNKILTTQEKVGIDERIVLYPKQFNDNITVDRIIKLYEINKKLQFLESNQISNFEKLNKIVEDQEVKKYSVYSGGLIDDWNFDISEE